MGRMVIKHVSAYHFVVWGGGDIPPRNLGIAKGPGDKICTSSIGTAGNEWECLAKCLDLRDRK